MDGEENDQPNTILKYSASINDGNHIFKQLLFLIYLFSSKKDY